MRLENRDVIIGFFGLVDFSVKPRCYPNPCRNSGTCTALEHGFECTCSIGYKGVHCEGTLLVGWKFTEKYLLINFLLLKLER